MHRGRRVEKDRHSLFSHKWRPPSSILLWPAILLHVVHTSPILRAIKLGFCQMKWCSINPTKLSDINYNPSWERYYPSFFTKFHTWGFQVLNVQHCPCYTSDNTSGFTVTVSIKNMRRKWRLSFVKVTGKKVLTSPSTFLYTVGTTLTKYWNIMEAISKDREKHN